MEEYMVELQEELNNKFSYELERINKAEKEHDYSFVSGACFILSSVVYEYSTVSTFVDVECDPDTGDYYIGVFDR